MIGWLEGIVIEKSNDHSIILNVNGMGYVVQLSFKNAASAIIGEHMAVFTELLVRENEMRLFGFSSLKEKACFLMLTSVQGVGPRVGMAILAILSPSDVAAALMVQDKNAFTQASGVGAKMAARIVNELKDKIPADFYDVTNLNETSIAANSSHNRTQKDNPSEPALQDEGISHPYKKATIYADATSALENLGYPRSDIQKTFQNLNAEDIESAEKLIRLALRALAQG